MKRVVGKSEEQVKNEIDKINTKVASTHKELTSLIKDKIEKINTVATNSKAQLSSIEKSVIKTEKDKSGFHQLITVMKREFEKSSTEIGTIKNEIEKNT